MIIDKSYISLVKKRVDSYRKRRIDTWYTGHFSRWKDFSLPIEKLFDDNIISVRCHNALKANNVTNLKQLIKLGDKLVNFKELKNIGEKSACELTYLYLKISPDYVKNKAHNTFTPQVDVLDLIIPLSPDSIHICKESLVSMLSLLDLPINLYQKYLNTQFVKDYYSTKSIFPISRVLYALLKDLYDKDEMTLWSKLYPVFNEGETVLPRVLKKQMGYTDYEFNKRLLNETKYITDIIRRFNKVTGLEDITSEYIDKHFSKNFYASSSRSVKQLLKEETSFISPDFLLYSVYLMYPDRYTLICSPFPMIYSTKRMTYDYSKVRNTYLIGKALSNVFDYEVLIEEINDKYESERLKDEVFNISDFVADSNAWRDGVDYDMLNQVTNTASDILLQGYHLCQDENRNVTLPANVIKKPQEALYDILKENGEVMQLEDIFEKMKQLYPGKYKAADQIRSLLRLNDKIISVQRSSTFALKEWDHVKRTIRDAVIDFLQSHDKPQNIMDIASYVIQFFPTTNERNIQSSLLVDDRFVNFNDGTFGLKTKQYASKYKPSERQKTKAFEERLIELDDFITIRHRFPYTNGDEDEKSLERWFRRARTGVISMTELQQNALKSILNKHADLPLTGEEYEWEKNYMALKQFVADKGRLPHFNRSFQEKTLYGWYVRFKSAYENYKLSDDRIKKYIELVKML